MQFILFSAIILCHLDIISNFVAIWRAKWISVPFVCSATTGFIKTPFIKTSIQKKSGSVFVCYNFIFFINLHDFVSLEGRFSLLVSADLLSSSGEWSIGFSASSDRVSLLLVVFMIVCKNWSKSQNNHLPVTIVGTTLTWLHCYLLSSRLISNCII